MRRANRKPIAEINVVPYIDVMLVLLVIFMITAPLLSQGVNVALPTAAAKALPDQKEPIIISVNHSGEYFLNISDHPDQIIAVDTLKVRVSQELAQARAQASSRPVFVKGDKHVEYDKIMQAMVLLQQAGADSVGLITQPDS